MTEPSTELIAPGEIADILLGGGNVEVLDAADVQEDIIRRILASPDLESAFAQAETTPARELDGVMLTVHNVKWAKSAFPEGAAVYALLQVTPDGADGDEIVSMGGRSLMASFLFAQINGHYPIRGTLRERQSKTNPERSFWTFELAH